MNFDGGDLNSTFSSNAPIEFEILDFPHLDSANENGYDIVDFSSCGRKTVNNEFVDFRTPTPVEESDVDEFEIIEDINPPDQK